MKKLHEKTKYIRKYKYVSTTFRCNLTSKRFKIGLDIYFHLL